MVEKKETRNVTLAHVASRAGVSISTASRVLNRSEVAIPISKATREKVLEVAGEMGYTPSVAARALRSGQTRTIGILGTSPDFFRLRKGMPAVHSTFVCEILFGMLDAAVGTGYNVTLLTGKGESDLSEMELLSKIGMVDGLVVLNRDLSRDPMTANALLHFRKPLVYLLDYQSDDALVVAPDDVGGGGLATRKLLEQGHRRIAFVEMPFFHDIFDRRLEGCRRAVAEATVDGGAEIVVVNDAEQLSVEELRDQECTAAVCANPECADHVVRVCGKSGWELPRDFELVTFSHDLGERSALAGMTDAPLMQFASVNAPLADIAGAGVRLLVERIENKTTESTVKLFPYRFHPGTTSRAGMG